MSPPSTLTSFQERLESNPSAAVVYAGLIGFALKIGLSASTFGTNDVIFWADFMTYVYDHDSVSIYREIPIYNHPPLVSGYLWLLGGLVGRESQLFPFVLRLPAILADVGSLFLVWKLSELHYADRRALWVTLIFALSPTLILISGFHGNSDPIFLFLALCSLYAFVAKRNALPAGLLLGLSANVKIVPLVLVPMFLFVTRRTGDRLRFVGALALTLVAGYGYHLSQAAGPLIRNVFFYRGWAGTWGIGKVLPPYTTFGTLVMAFAIVALMAAVGWRLTGMDEGPARDRKVLQAFALTFLAALVFAPGFGVQYLSWLVPAFCFVAPAAALGYALLSGALLLVLYLHWSGGLPLYFANSMEPRPPSDLASVLDGTLWVSLCVVLCLLSVHVLSTENRDARARRSHSASPG